MGVNDKDERSFQVVDAEKTAADFVPERPTRRLSDLVGAATVKRYLTSTIEGARQITTNGPGPWLGGSLLYGPPNCGKTFAVEVIAGELGATLWHIDLDTPWHRNNIAGILQRALADRPSYGSIIYLNQVDNRAAAELVRPQLRELDEARTHAKIGVLGAAVHPWSVDKEIARPGRLGNPILVLPPDEPLRHQFIKLRLGATTAADADLDWIVERTDGHSFGDLARLVKSVVAHAEGGTVDRTAWRVARADVPPTAAEWLSTAGQHAMMSQAGGIYDDLLAYFARRTKY